MGKLQTLSIANIVSTVADAYSKSETDALLADKQDLLTAGENISIAQDGTISATDTTYTAGVGIDITNGVISSTADTDIFIVEDELPDTAEAEENKIYIIPKDGGTDPNVYEEWYISDGAWEKIGEDTIDLSNYYNKTETDALLDDKQDALTAGENITIAQDGTISATDTTYNDATTSASGLMSAADKTKLDGLTNYTAGENVQISGGVISATDTTYENATQSTAGLMSAADKTKLDGIDTSDFLTCDTVLDCESVSDALDAKQDTLTAGSNITIENGTIYATDTTYTAGNNITITNNQISADTYNQAYIDALEDRIEALEAILEGKGDIPIVKTDYDNTTVTVNVLGEVVSE